MKASTSWLAVVLTTILIPIANIVFGTGFFPYKPFLPGLAAFSSAYDPPPPPFTRVVFMVIDALRSDFVYSASSSFGFTQSLVRAGRAIPFTAHATSPTITLPRVKAITTGSIPGFLDVILNFAEDESVTSLAAQDTWLAQLRARGGNLVMYGDDTWANLFPGMFARVDGTSSFFVSDFFEVDRNVTRHVEEELRRDDWDAWIMHYLGLDHIGHKAGPRSSFMPPKQREMDAVVERIYSAIEEDEGLRDTLFVLAGDHGMNDAGNHGGSGPGETSPALLFMSPKLARIAPEGRECPSTPRAGEFGFYTTVEQSDIAPTLAGLLGFPVPRNNLGVFIEEMLPLWEPGDQVELVWENARQLGELVTAAFPEFPRREVLEDCEHAKTDEAELSCRWTKAEDEYSLWKDGGGDPEAVLQLLLTLCHRSQEVLSMTASNYNLKTMSLGLSIQATMAVFCTLALAPLLASDPLGALTFLATTLSYSTMMFASSYVEEEHHFWYWLLSGLYTLTFVAHRRRNRTGLAPLLTLLLLRLARRWNQTGVKHAGAPDIAHTFLPAHPTLLWLLILATYAELLASVARHSFRRAGREAAWVYAFTATAAAAAFKLSYAAQDAAEMVPAWLWPVVEFAADASLVVQARAVFAVLAAGAAYTLLFETGVRASSSSSSSSSSQSKTRSHSHYHSAGPVFHDLVTLFLATQTRAVNVPLLLVFRLMAQLQAHSGSVLSPAMESTVFLALQHTAFFALGNANAISAVDLSNAYNGVDGYSLAVVSALTFVSNWVGPLFWASAAPVVLARRVRRGGGEREEANGREGEKGEKEKGEKEEGEKEEGEKEEGEREEGDAGRAEGGGDVWLRHSLMMATFQVVAVAATMAACTAMRTHLFVWTVFSPKYLYAMVWSGIFQSFGNALLGAGVWWAARRGVVVGKEVLEGGGEREAVEKERR